MFKKIINPSEELNYRQDGIENKYLINEGSRAIGLFSSIAGMSVPTQISPQDIMFYIFEGKIEISTEDKVFEIKSGEMLLIPKTSAFSIKFIENSKLFTVRI